MHYFTIWENSMPKKWKLGYPEYVYIVEIAERGFVTRANKIECADEE